MPYRCAELIIEPGTNTSDGLKEAPPSSKTTACVGAKAAAGDKNVLVHGAGIAQRALIAGLIDELEIHLVPVLFGAGRRLFEHLGLEHHELERIRVMQGEGGVTHLRYRVRR